MSARPVRVLLVDDDDLMRAGLRAVLSSDAAIEVVGEAGDGRAAVQEARARRPDVVLMDVRMPDLDGIAATRELLAGAPDLRVAILTTFEQDDYIFGALNAGASGFLLKRTKPEELIGAIHTLAAGDSLLSPSVTRRRDRGGPRHRGIDGEDARQAHPDEAQAPRPRPGGDLRVRERAHRAGLMTAAALGGDEFRPHRGSCEQMHFRRRGALR